MLPRVGVGGLQASTTTYFVRSVSCAFRSHSGKSRHANGGRPDRAAEAGDNRAFHGTTCQAALSREEHPPALPQLVAIDDCALSARHVVEDAALDKRVYARVAEQDQRCTIILAAPLPPDLPSLGEQSSAVSPLPPSWTPPASLPRIGLNASPPSACRCAAYARSAALAPRVATPPPRRRGA